MTAADTRATSTGEPFLVELTAHPLQRVGAFALAVLAKESHPRRVSEDRFLRVWNRMTEDAVAATRETDAKQPGAFLLSASYALWPNSKMNIPSLRKLSADQRGQAVVEWRTPRPPGSWPEAPCALCGRRACGFYGKVDVPLAMSTEYRNTTVVGHDGMPLCRTCLGSFYALPYACHFQGGRATITHAWDEDFLSFATRHQVEDTRKRIGRVSVTPSKWPAYVRESLLVNRIRAYGHPVRSDVSLIIFTNNNQEQELTEQRMDQPLVEWIHAVRQDKTSDPWNSLERACHSEKVPGAAALAGELVRSPRRLPAKVLRYLVPLLTSAPDTRDEIRQLVGALRSFVGKVLHVNDRELQEIEGLGKRTAALMMATRKKVKPFVVAYRKSTTFRKWFNDGAVEWLLWRDREELTSLIDTTEPFVTPTHLRWLFEPDEQAWLRRNLLFVAVIHELHSQGYRPDSDDTRSIEDTLHTDGEDKENDE
ncbi:hypothetical protein [Actinoalloteichus caeruleus]|uniref:hypothetical protein n=1 Tax=Actinoalloteichus cyanogriseus TaxID=2893586 RepID=UPI003AACC795